MNPENERVIAIIRQAFADVKLEGGVSLHLARLLDDYCDDVVEKEKAACEDQDISWEEISADKLAHYSDTFAFFDSKAFRYYVPAFMIASLRDSKFDDFFIYNLDCKDHPADYGKRWDILTDAQKTAIYEYLVCRSQWEEMDAGAAAAADTAADAIAHYWQRFKSSK